MSNNKNKRGTVWGITLASFFGFLILGQSEITGRAVGHDSLGCGQAPTTEDEATEDALSTPAAIKFRRKDKATWQGYILETVAGDTDYTGCSIDTTETFSALSAGGLNRLNIHLQQDTANYDCDWNNFEEMMQAQPSSQGVTIDAGLNGDHMVDYDTFAQNIDRIHATVYDSASDSAAFGNIILDDFMDSLYGVGNLVDLKGPWLCPDDTDGDPPLPTDMIWAHSPALENCTTTPPTTAPLRPINTLEAVYNHAHSLGSPAGTEALRVTPYFDAPGIFQFVIPSLVLGVRGITNTSPRISASWDHDDDSDTAAIASPYYSKDGCTTDLTNCTLKENFVMDNGDYAEATYQLPATPLRQRMTLSFSWGDLYNYCWDNDGNPATDAHDLRDVDLVVSIRTSGGGSSAADSEVYRQQINPQGCDNNTASPRDLGSLNRVKQDFLLPPARARTQQLVFRVEFTGTGKTQSNDRKLAYIWDIELTDSSGDVESLDVDSDFSFATHRASTDPDLDTSYFVAQSNQDDRVIDYVDGVYFRQHPDVTSKILVSTSTAIPDKEYSSFDAGAYAAFGEYLCENLHAANKTCTAIYWAINSGSESSVALSMDDFVARLDADKDYVDGFSTWNTPLGLYNTEGGVFANRTPIDSTYDVMGYVADNTIPLPGFRQTWEWEAPCDGTYTVAVSESMLPSNGELTDSPYSDFLSTVTHTPATGIAEEAGKDAYSGGEFQYTISNVTTGDTISFQFDAPGGSYAYLTGIYAQGLVTNDCGASMPTATYSAGYADYVRDLHQCYTAFASSIGLGWQASCLYDGL